VITVANKKNYNGLNGKIGGLAVKGMIREVERQMVAGKTISAAPSSPQEAESLMKIRMENKQSAQNAKN
jgi:hypothetical protein